MAEVKRRQARRGHKCRFCRDAREVEYKDIDTLTKLTSAQGKASSRKRSGNCARHQRAMKRAVKRARFMALMPYVA
jgi:small subunit ribosomal protein S18